MAEAETGTPSILLLPVPAAGQVEAVSGFDFVNGRFETCGPVSALDIASGRKAQALPALRRALFFTSGQTHAILKALPAAGLSPMPVPPSYHGFDPAVPRPGNDLEAAALTAQLQAMVLCSRAGDENTA
jgi:hypothetical protein